MMEKEQDSQIPDWRQVSMAGAACPEKEHFE
jgi:hypothetical protein